MISIQEEYWKQYELIESHIEKGICLYGACSNGIWVLEYLKKKGYKVVCFCDSAQEKIGQIIEDIPVVSWEEAKQKFEGIIFITTKHYVKDILETIQYKKAISFDTWFLLKNYEKYKKIQFDDKKSNVVLQGIMKSMLTGDEIYCSEVAEGNAYFGMPSFFTNVRTYVDVGTFVGDSLENFIFAVGGCFDKIYAFEPGYRQYEALQCRCKRLEQEWALESEKIVLEQSGVGDPKEQYVLQEGNGGLSATKLCKIENGTGDGIVSLDDYFADKKISLLKADIEGMEMDMLRGGEAVIMRDKPRLAICVYHRPDDLFNIYEFIKRLVPEYKVLLRQHSARLVETVLYCYI